MVGASYYVDKMLCSLVQSQEPYTTVQLKITTTGLKRVCTAAACQVLTAHVGHTVVSTLERVYHLACRLEGYQKDATLDSEGVSLLNRTNENLAQ